MSEIPAIRNESRQETFSSSLKEGLTFCNFICLGSLVICSQILPKFRFRRIGMSYITETGETEVTATEWTVTYFYTAYH